MLVILNSPSQYSNNVRNHQRDLSLVYFLLEINYYLYKEKFLSQLSDI